MQQAINKNIQVIAWGLGLTVITVGILGWGANLNWNLASPATYSLFPLLGILAFSLMWTHYILYALRIYSGFDKTILQSYQRITGIAVLICILLHPGLFIMQLYIDGNGLPPESYKSYVDDSAIGFVMLGTIAWLAFMAYEFKEKHSEKAWWKYVSAANIVAMLLILIHAKNLGSTVASDWFGIVWMLYGLTLIASYGYLLFKKKLV